MNLVSLLLTLPVLALAAWGLATVWRVDRALAAVLDETVEALRSLKLEKVTTWAQHEGVQGTIIEAQGIFEAMTRAWADFEEALVDVAGQPRAPLPARAFFHPDALLMRQSERKALLLSPGALTALPSLLISLGTLGSILVVISTFAAPDAAPWRELLPSVVGPALTPLGAALAARVTVRLLVARWQGQLEDGCTALAWWLDRHYRSVTAIELLARLVAASPKSAER